MTASTVKLHRVFRAPAQRIYRAFIDAEAMVKWLPPHGFTGKVHHIKAEVGGTYKMSFTNFSSGHSHSFGGEFLELVPNERIRHTDKFDDPSLAGQMQTTVSLKEVSCGTEVTIVQEGIPSVIPVEGCYVGWQESLTTSGAARRARDYRALTVIRSHEVATIAAWSGGGRRVIVLPR